MSKNLIPLNTKKNISIKSVIIPKPIVKNKIKDDTPDNKTLDNKTLEKSQEKIPDNKIPDKNLEIIPDNKIPDKSQEIIPDKNLEKIPDNKIPEKSQEIIPDNKIPDKNLEKIPDNKIPDNILEKKLVKKVVDDIPEVTPKKRNKKITKEELDKKREYGQYYTTEPILLEKIQEFIFNNPDVILEPSVGKGDLILPVMKKFPKAKYDLYEIDDTLESKVDNVNYCNFLMTNIDTPYKTIVGNPPFVKTKSGNLAIDFVRKCFGLLEQGGELIFIVPADFFKLTSTATLISEMMQIGTFTHIFHPEEENLFANATINVMVFRYCKNSKLPKKCLYNNVKKNIINNDGTLLFLDENIKSHKLFSDYFDIYVGLVSGRDEVFKSLMGNIEVLVHKNQKEKFIYSKIFPTNNSAIDEYLLDNKKILLERQIRKFNEDNWFEWGAPRNVSIMEGQKGKKCIYLYNLTRKDEVAFEGTVDYFGGNFIMLIPRESIDLRKVVEYINSKDFKKNYLYGGRFKIGHRQISNAIYPL